MERLISKGTAAAFAVGKKAFKKSGGASAGLKRAVALYRANLHASGIETEGHDPAEGHGAEHESPTGKAGDAITLKEHPNEQ